MHRIGGAAFAGELDAKRAIDMGTRLAAQVEETAEGDEMALGPPVTWGEQVVQKIVSMRK